MITARSRKNWSSLRMRPPLPASGAGTRFVFSGIERPVSVSPAVILRTRTRHAARHSLSGAKPALPVIRVAGASSPPRVMAKPAPNAVNVMAVPQRQNGSLGPSCRLKLTAQAPACINRG